MICDGFLITSELEFSFVKNLDPQTKFSNKPWLLVSTAAAHPSPLITPTTAQSNELKR